MFFFLRSRRGLLVNGSEAAAASAGERVCGEYLCELLKELEVVIHVLVLRAESSSPSARQERPDIRLQNKQ